MPKFLHLKFHPLLKPLKRSWNSSTEKYAYFWDGMSVLNYYASCPLVAPAGNCKPEVLMNFITGLRARTIVISRLLCLFRSIDLANLKRTVSVQENDEFGWGGPLFIIQKKRMEGPQVGKNYFYPRNGLGLPLPSYAALCFIHPRVGGPGGSPVCVHATPHQGLSADRIASITQKELARLGVDTTVFGAHATRGVGVSIYKKLGLSSEEVCEIGAWKNVSAFSAHYQRLGAQQKAGSLLFSVLGAQSSLCGSAELDVSRTPPRPKEEGGGSDTDSEAQTHSEVTLVDAGKCSD